MNHTLTDLRGVCGPNSCQPLVWVSTRAMFGSSSTIPYVFSAHSAYHSPFLLTAWCSLTSSRYVETLPGAPRALIDQPHRNPWMDFTKSRDALGATAKTLTAYSTTVHKTGCASAPSRATSDTDRRKRSRCSHSRQTSSNAARSSSRSTSLPLRTRPPSHPVLTLTRVLGTRARRYFNKSSKLSLKSWEIGQEDARTPCGHCDNCTRAPDTLERPGARARVAAWQVLRVAEDTRKELTLTQLCDLARGLGSSATASVGKGKGKGRAKEKVTVDLERAAGGRVELSKEVRVLFSVCGTLLPPRLFALNGEGARHLR